MKQITLKFGLILGSVLAASLIFVTYMCYSAPEFQGNTVLGYLGIIIAFSLIFFGVRNYRDKQLGGVITFGRAFKTGLIIAVISSLIYVVVWLFMYYLFVPDFMEVYTTHHLKNFAAEGATAAEYAEEVKKMEWYSDMYKNPLMVVILTFFEPFPVGLIVSLISALILSRKPRAVEAAVPA